MKWINNKKKSGFTLIETIVTMSIMASVTAASYPYVIKKVQQNSANKIAGEIKKIEEGAQNYYANNSSFKWPDQDNDCSEAILELTLTNKNYIPASIVWSVSDVGAKISGNRLAKTECPLNAAGVRNFKITVSALSGTTSDYQNTVNNMVAASASGWESGSDGDDFSTSTTAPSAVSVATTTTNILNDIIGYDETNPPANTIIPRLDIAESDIDTAESDISTNQSNITTAQSTASDAITKATTNEATLLLKADLNGSSTQDFAVKELTVGTIDNRVNILGESPFVTLKENDVVNNPQWWWGADGGSFSLRLNNTGTYPIHFKTNATNTAVNEIKLGSLLSVAGKGVFSNASQNSKVVIGTDSNNLLQFSDSNWTNNPDHHILKKSWNSSLGDWLMLKAPGDSISNQSAILLSDTQGVYFGRGTNTGIAANDATAPLNNNNYAKIGSTSWFNGNVGVADINPAAKLTVYGTNADGWNSGLRLTREDGGDGAIVVDSAGMKLKTLNSGNAFFFRNSANNTRLLIADNGNVGINTTSPTEKLEVNGNIKAKKIFLDDGNGGSIEVGGSGDDGKGWTSGTYDIGTGMVTFASDDGLGFTTDDLRGADADVDTFVQKSGDAMTGSLGVSGGQIRMLIDGNGHASLELQPDASGKSSYIDITAGSGSDYGMRLGVGNITTMSSAMKIRTVNTDAITIDTSQNTTFHGNITVSSDKRLKSNIKPLEDSLSKLMNIRGVSYVKKASNQPEIGVIAQEVEKQYPELIRNRDDGMKSVNYNGLIGVLIESVKQLSSEMNILRAETHRLRQELKVLNQRR